MLAPDAARFPSPLRTVCLLALAGAGVSCQGDPSVLGDVQQPPIRRTGGHVELSARVRSEERKPKVRDGTDTEDERIIREAVRVDTAGYVYHPRLLEYTAGGLFGLVQSDFESSIAGSDRSNSDDGETIEYDLTAELLNQTVYPVTLFAHRHDDLVPRPFSASERQVLSETGALWQYLDEVTPTSVQYTSRRLKFDPIDDTDVERDKSVDELNVETEYVASDDLSFDLDYTRQSVSEDPFDIDYDVNDLRLGGQYRFGEESEHRLDVDASVYDQSGSLELERNQWRNRLELKHSDTLRSWFQTEVTNRSQRGLSGDSIDDDTLRAAATLEHRLYESLVSQVGGYLEHQEFSAGPVIDRTSAFARLDYRKKNRWGVLTANYSIEGQESDRSGRNQIISVIDESRTFVDPDPIVLSDPNVVESTIRITDVTSLTVYREGTDYRVREFANRTEIRRIPTGTIANGETVLLDYEIRNGADFTLSTLYQRFGIRQYFPSGLTPYYRLERQDQSISGSREFAPIPEDITAHVVGIEFVGAVVQAMAEYEDHDSSIAPFTARRLGAGYTHRFENDATGGLNARFTDVDWSAPMERDRTFFDLYGSYRHPLSERLTFESDLRYLKQEDSISGNDEGLGLEFTLEWLFRQSELTVTYQIGRFENDFAENATSLLTVNFVRHF